MKKIIAFSILTGLGLAGISPGAQAMTSDDSIDWSQPPIMCVEEVELAPETTLCPSPNAKPKQRAAFAAQYPVQAKVCSAKQVLDAEKARPNSQSRGNLWNAYFAFHRKDGVPEKINEIYGASEKYGIPTQILYGSLVEESFLTNLGVQPDYGNYSCGMGQFNIRSWCEWANHQSADVKAAVDWPGQMNCEGDLVSPDNMKLFYQLANQHPGRIENLGVFPAEFKRVSDAAILAKLHGNLFNSSKKVLRALKSFAYHCAETHYAIEVTAYTLKQNYDNVPNELKNQEIYAEGSEFNRTCQRDLHSRYYPMNTGWLMSDSIYNIGPTATDLVKNYYSLSPVDSIRSSGIKNPVDMIEAIAMSGVYDPKTGKINYKNSTDQEVDWFRICVNQGHMARVIQDTTQPGTTLARSLFSEACELGLKKDPSTGVLFVPASRMTTPGYKLN